MELGLMLLPYEGLPRTLARYRQCMEDIDPHTIWLPDRLLGDDLSALKAYLGDHSATPPLEILDPFLVIALMAQAGKRPREFALGVTDFVRRGAPDLARTATTLSQILEQPFNIGFGAGEAVNLKPLGYRHGEKPVSHMKEELQRFKSINDKGLYISPDGAQTQLGYCDFPSKIWLGGQRERLLRMTAQYADGWLPAWKMSPTEYGEKARQLKQWATEFHRPCPKLGMFCSIMLGPSRREILEQLADKPLAKLAALRLPGDAWSAHGLQHPAGENSKGLFDVVVGDIAPDIVYRALCEAPAEMLAEVSFIGSTDEVLEELSAYREHGLNHLAFMMPPVGSSADADRNYPEFKRLCAELQHW